MPTPITGVNYVKFLEDPETGEVTDNVLLKGADGFMKQIPTSEIGGNQNLQEVTDNGNSTTNSIVVQGIEIKSDGTKNTKIGENITDSGSMFVTQFGHSAGQNNSSPYVTQLGIDAGKGNSFAKLIQINASTDGTAAASADKQIVFQTGDYPIQLDGDVSMTTLRHFADVPEANEVVAINSVTADGNGDVGLGVQEILDYNGTATLGSGKTLNITKANGGTLYGLIKIDTDGLLLGSEVAVKANHIMEYSTDLSAFMAADNDIPSIKKVDEMITAAGGGTASGDGVDISGGVVDLGSITPDEVTTTLGLYSATVQPGNIQVISSTGGATGGNTTIIPARVQFLTPSTKTVELNADLSDNATYNLPAHSGTHTLADDVDLALKANLASPTFTGSVVVPNQTQGDNSTKAANTAYVDAAIAGAEKRIYRTATPSSAITGVTTEQQVGSTITIPANTLASADLFKIQDLKLIKTGAAGTTVLKVKINTSNNFATAVDIATIGLTAAQMTVNLERTFRIGGGNITGYSFTNSNTPSDKFLANTNVSSTTFTPSATMYLFFSIQNGNAADSTLIDFVEITN